MTQWNIPDIETASFVVASVDTDNPSVVDISIGTVVSWSFVVILLFAEIKSIANVKPCTPYKTWKHYV